MPKLKTRKAAAKRFKATGTGKFMRRRAFHNHLLDHKSPKLKRHLKTKAVVDERDAENVSLNVGFYYMANAAGRLLGTLLSGALFVLGENATIGMQLCLWCSSVLVLFSWLSSLRLPSLINPVSLKGSSL